MTNEDSLAVRERELCEIWNDREQHVQQFRRDGEPETEIRKWIDAAWSELKDVRDEIKTLEIERERRLRRMDDEERTLEMFLERDVATYEEREADHCKNMNQSETKAWGSGYFYGLQAVCDRLREIEKFRGSPDGD